MEPLPLDKKCRRSFFDVAMGSTPASAAVPQSTHILVALQRPGLCTCLLHLCTQEGSKREVQTRQPAWRADAAASCFSLLSCHETGTYQMQASMEFTLRQKSRRLSSIMDRGIAMSSIPGTCQSPWRGSISKSVVTRSLPGSVNTPRSPRDRCIPCH